MPGIEIKEQHRSYQHSVENERTVTQHRHRGILFASVNGFISRFALDNVQEHMALFNLNISIINGSIQDHLMTGFHCTTCQNQSQSCVPRYLFFEFQQPLFHCHAFINTRKVT